MPASQVTMFQMIAPIRAAKITWSLMMAGDTMAFIVGNEIYDHLEKVVDRFEDVANRISGIVIEQV